MIYLSYCLEKHFFKLFLVSKYQIHPIKSKSERKKDSNALTDKRRGSGQSCCVFGSGRSINVQLLTVASCSLMHDLQKVGHSLHKSNTISGHYPAPTK